MSSNDLEAPGVFVIPVAEFHYRQMEPSKQPVVVPKKEVPREPEIRLTESAFQKRLDDTAAQAVMATEARMEAIVREQTRTEALRVSKTIQEFETSCKEYFSRVEAEIVQLALAIAAKILHREAQVEPLLVAAIVQIALNQLKKSSCATLRVRPEHAQRWRRHFASEGLDLEVTVTEDEALTEADYILETEMGAVNFNLDLQLKEVERGFFDVLAQRPRS